MTDDLLNHLEEITSSNGGRVEDVTPIMTKWAFQSTLNTACLLVEYAYLIMSITDTAYFVFGENLEVYNTNKQTHQDFMEAGLEFIKQVGLLVPLPIFHQ